LALIAPTFAQYGNSYPLSDDFLGTPETSATYDYVLIGGGTVGLNIASRFAEN